MSRFNTPMHRILLTIATLVPVFWLVLSDEGRRWTDEAMLQLMGGESATLEFQKLSSKVAKRDVLGSYPKLKFDCARDEKRSLEVCSAPVASVNSIPGRTLRFDFHDGELRMVQFHYRRSHHDLLREAVEFQLAKLGSGTTDPGLAALAWPVGDGTLLIPRAPREEADAVLVWTAAKLAATK